MPAGVGRQGFVRLSRDEFREVVEQGAAWAVDRGYGWPEDLERTEEGGCIAGADAGKVSDRAVERGYNQIGTLGSGNHYLEIQVVQAGKHLRPRLGRAFGIRHPQPGGRHVPLRQPRLRPPGGHRLPAELFLAVMETKYGIRILDRELACAPFRSPEGQDYFAAMKCAINMSFANRQVILHRIREVFSEVLHRDPRDLGMHRSTTWPTTPPSSSSTWSTARLRELLVHRKGATRAFGPGMAGLPGLLRETGQPVIIGGSMETGSYLLVGVDERRGRPSSSTAHGSGRTMSRHGRQKKSTAGRKAPGEMEERGIYVRSASMAGLAEEAGAAYKNIDEVVEATELAGISRPVVPLFPDRQHQGIGGRSMPNRTPLTLITGSLGSGKTTLLQRIIAAADTTRLAVLINEFGEIGIDGRVIKGEHLRLIELAGGCVCCVLAGEFVAAVNELLDQYRPDMIVLEATGVAEADALVYEVEDDLPRVRLDCVICIVDGWADVRYPRIGYVSRLQLQRPILS